MLNMANKVLKLKVPYFLLHKMHFPPQKKWGRSVCILWSEYSKKGFSHHHPEASHCHAGRPLNWHQRLLAVWTSPFCTAGIPGSASYSPSRKPARLISVGNENRQGPKGKKSDSRKNKRNHKHSSPLRQLIFPHLGKS